MLLSRLELTRYRGPHPLLGRGVKRSGTMTRLNSLKNRKVTARIPASTTNLGPGFDVLGLALQLYSTVTLELSETDSLSVSGVDTDKIPSTPEHVAFQAAELVFHRSGAKRPKGFKLQIENGIPAIRGLGGSGTAILGGLLTANALCGYFHFLTQNSSILRQNWRGIPITSPPHCMVDSSFQHRRMLRFIPFD